LQSSRIFTLENNGDLASWLLAPGSWHFFPHAAGTRNGADPPSPPFSCRPRPSWLAALHSNTDVTAGLYYRLTKSLTLVGELSQVTSKDFAGDTAHLHGASVGAILFF
jgi:hypothetical protein